LDNIIEKFFRQNNIDWASFPHPYSWED
jgi:hypothetical protein